MRPTHALNQHRDAVRAIALRHRVTNVRVFGSVLHGTDTEASDLDLLVDQTPGTSLMDIARIELELVEGVARLSGGGAAGRGFSAGPGATRPAAR